MKDYLKVANDPFLWIMAMPLVVIAGIQALSFTKAALSAREEAGLTKEEGKQAFRIGVISAIGPSLANLVVMIGMIAVIGAPITWQRLSVIGSGPAELAGAAMGAKAMGVEFGSANYGVTEFASSVWVMSLNAIGWLLVVALLADKISLVQEKITGGKTEMMGQMGTGAIIGAASFIVTSQIVINKSLQKPNLVAVIVAGIFMLILNKLSENRRGLKEWSLGISMFIAMFIAALI